MNKFVEDLKATLADMQEANKPDSPLRTRELSLAITKIEEAILWLGHVRN